MKRADNILDGWVAAAKDIKVFPIRIYKTASQSITKVISSDSRFDVEAHRKICHTKQPLTDMILHSTAERIMERYPKEWGEWYSFAIMRNPVDRLVSAYLFICDRYEIKEAGQAHFEKFARLLVGELSNESVRKVALAKDYPVRRIYCRQCEFILDGDGEILVDDLFRFENLGNSWKIISSHIGIDSKLPHVNADRAGINITVPPDLRRQIEEYYHDDCDLYESL